MKLHELQEKRAAAVLEMRTLADRADVEKRDLSADELTKFDALKVEIADLDKRIGRAQALAEFERSAPAISHNGVGDGDFETRCRQDFSLTRLIASSLPANMGGSDAGLERELCKEVETRSGKSPSEGGWMVPDAVLSVERRDLTVAGGAAALVPSPHLAERFIPLLRSKMVLGKLGATYIDDLRGSPVELPRQSGTVHVYFLGEDELVTESSPSFDDVSLSPKTAAALTSYFRRAVLNTSPSIEALVRNDLAAAIASALDRVALVGSGVGNEPRGVVNQPGVRTVTVSNPPTWAEILEFPAAIDAANVDGQLAFVSNPWVIKKLRSTPKIAGTDSVMLMEGPTSLAGYAAASTSALPGSDPAESPTENGVLAFGDWSSVLVATWGSGTEILANPFLSGYYEKGRIAVRAMRDTDVNVARPEAFAVATNINTE